MKHYPVAKPYLGKEEERALIRVLRSGVLSIGSEVTNFEVEFAQKVGTKFACAVTNGTAGLHLALLTAQIGPGDEVITSPFSFIASANAILYVGATPVFVDVDPRTGNLDATQAARKITSRTKAILVVHIFGQPADMHPLIKLARKHSLLILEDACESLGAQCRNRNVGTFGQSAVFAFYPNKQITTAEGGMIVTNNKKIDELCRSLRNQGRSGNMKWLDHQRLGYNYRLDELRAAIGREQLKKLDYTIAQRRALAGMYRKYLEPYKHLIEIPEVAAGNTHTWFVYVIRLKNKTLKRDVVMKMLEKKGVATKPYLPSIHLFDFYRKKFHYRKGDFPISESISNTSLALPLFVGLKEKDVQYITQTLIEVIEQHGKHI